MIDFLKNWSLFVRLIFEISVCFIFLKSSIFFAKSNFAKAMSFNLEKLFIYSILVFNVFWAYGKSSAIALSISSKHFSESIIILKI